MKCLPPSSSSDWFASLSYLGISLDVYDTEIGCTLQGANMQMWELSSVLWTSCIATYLIISVSKHRVLSDKTVMTIMILIAWGVPASFTAYLLARDAFRLAGLWCWISSDFVQYRVSLFYAYVMFSFPYNCIVIAILIRRVIASRWASESIANIQSKASTRVSKRLLGRCLLILLGFVVVWIVPLVNRLMRYANPTFQNDVIDVLQALLNPLQGFCNFMAYGRDSKKYFLQIVRRSKRRKTEATDSYVLSRRETEG